MGGNSPKSDYTGDALRSIRDRFPFKRNNSSYNSNNNAAARSKTTPLPHKTSRSHHHHRRKLSSFFSFRGRQWWFYLCFLIVIFAFALVTVVLQNPITSVFRQADRMRWPWSGMKFGSSLEFLSHLSLNGSRLDWLRSQPTIGIRPPRICLILGNLKKDPSTLMLYSVMKNLKGLGYALKIYALENGRAISIWQEIGGQVTILRSERYGSVDWSIFEGIIAHSIEAKYAISSLMQEPFCSVPLIWNIQEDILANRLELYQDRGWHHLISDWKDAFSRANAVVFPAFSFPMLYSALDSGNFIVIPGSPADVWAAEVYNKTHSKSQLRKKHNFANDEVVILVVGSSFFYNELAWDYAVAMHDIEPLLREYAGSNKAGLTSKFIFLSGNSSNNYSDALQDVTTRLRLDQGSLRRYDINSDINGLMLMADIVLYGSSQDEQAFPPLLSRALSFGIPVVAPNYPVIMKYVFDGLNGIIFPKNDPGGLKSGFSRLIFEGKLSDHARSIASNGKLMVKNMLAPECLTSYAKLVENVFDFPSDVLLPGRASELNHSRWQWDPFRWDIEQTSSGIENPLDSTSIVYELEDDVMDFIPSQNFSQESSDDLELDVPTTADWDILNEMESSEEVDRLEREEIDERMGKEIGIWDEVYRSARKSEKLRFEINERDEGELERTGQPICIYEIYSGAGGWPFLHHGSLYRGLSLTSGARRLRSDDINAVGRLRVLNNTYYRDILCEMGGMFSIANGIDDIHKRPWIGFQSWRAAGRKASLSKKAELVLEKTIKDNSKGDVIYFWSRVDMDDGIVGSTNMLTFWSTCDIMNGGRCRTAFEDAFRAMYFLPSNVEALPPMPEDGGHWSALHSWVMPTPSFLEFIMFSRMFVDSLHSLHVNSSKTPDCSLGLSASEKQHCYCRILELLVNVWAYHSGRQMIYMDPHSGILKEQHPIEERKGLMWTKYMNFSILKKMDEALAEAADDNDSVYEAWLWPLTGEVYWQGMYEREREERYRLKMEKKRRMKEKMHERLKHGYKQKTLAGG